MLASVVSGVQMCTLPAKTYILGLSTKLSAQKWFLLFCILTRRKKEAVCLDGLTLNVRIYYSRFRINPSPLKIFSAFKFIHSSAGPNPFYLIEVKQHWINSYTVLNCKTHNTPVPNLFPEVLISA